MKRFMMRNFMSISGTLIFISLFMRFYLTLYQIDIFSIGFNSPIDYTSLLLMIIGIGLSITTFYYLPLLFLVKYHFNFTLRFNIQDHKKSCIIRAYSIHLSKQNTFKINNVIRC